MKRNAVVAGSFYPSEKQALKKQVDDFLSRVKVDIKSEKLIALLSPHAGYIYSGPIAAYSYAQLVNGGYEVALVLAPSHRARFDGASVIPEGTYSTPLGDVVIDSEIGQKLVKKPGFGFIEQVHNGEHSLEVQVPFLQEVLPVFSLVPIIVGTDEINHCEAIANSIYEVLKSEKRKFIIIVSTDLSHYHNYDQAVKMDHSFIDALKSYDEELVLKRIHAGICEACGIAPVITSIILSKLLGGKKVTDLFYANSGDTAGDKSQVVGYLSAAITG